MLLHNLELFIRQLAGLEKYGVGDADLTDVVKTRTHPETLEEVVLMAELVGQSARIGGQTLAVRLRALIPRLDRCADTRQNPQIGFL